MVEIEVQKACQGDCIWLRCVAEKSVKYCDRCGTFDILQQVSKI